MICVQIEEWEEFEELGLHSKAREAASSLTPLQHASPEKRVPRHVKQSAFANSLMGHSSLSSGGHAPTVGFAWTTDCTRLTHADFPAFSIAAGCSSPRDFSTAYPVLPVRDQR